MTQCCISGCVNSRYNATKNTTCFNFPMHDKILLKKWLEQIELPNWKPTQHKMCCKHFVETDMYTDPDTKKILLKPDSVPTIFPRKRTITNATERRHCPTILRSAQQETSLKTTTTSVGNDGNSNLSVIRPDSLFLIPTQYPVHYQTQYPILVAAPLSQQLNSQNPIILSDFLQTCQQNATNNAQFLQQVCTKNSVLCSEFLHVKDEKTEQILQFSQTNPQNPVRISEISQINSQNTTRMSQINSQSTIRMTQIAPINSQSSMINSQILPINVQSSMINSQSLPINSQSSLINSQILPINSQSSMINSQFSPINSKSAMINSKILPINLQSSMINSKTLPINSQSSMINSQSLPINSQSLLINSQILPINSQSSMINSQNLPINVQSSMINSKILPINSQSSMINSKILPINSQSSMINSKILPINSQNSMINSKILPINLQSSMKKTEFLQINEKSPIKKAEFLQINEQSPIIKTELLQINEQSPIIKTEFLQINEQSDSSVMENLSESHVDEDTMFQPKLRKILPKPVTTILPKTEIISRVRQTEIAGKPDILILPIFRKTNNNDSNETNLTVLSRYPDNKRPTLKITINKSYDVDTRIKDSSSNVEMKNNSMINEDFHEKEITIENERANKSVTFRLDRRSGEIVMETREIVESSRDDGESRITRTKRKVDTSESPSAVKLRRLYAKGQQECRELRKRLIFLQNCHRREQREIQNLQDHLSVLDDRVRKTDHHDDTRISRLRRSDETLNIVENGENNCKNVFTKFTKTVCDVKKMSISMTSGENEESEFFDKNATLEKFRDSR